MRSLLIAALLLGACSHNSHVEPGDPKHPLAPEHPEQKDGGANVALPSNGTVPPVDPSNVTAAQPPAKVKISIRSSPSKVMVSWGKKKLGLTPLVVERPRDSGPMDLVLRDGGHFPVHVRAYTVKNDSFDVHMTRWSAKMTLFGAKQEIVETPVDPSDPTATPAAGTTPTAGTAPPPGTAQSPPKP